MGALRCIVAAEDARRARRRARKPSARVRLQSYDRARDERGDRRAKPGIIDDILAGIVFEFDISQTFVVIALMIVGIPALMIVLSMTLPARANRTLNLVVASLCIPVAVFNVVGESWVYFYVLGVLVEVILLAYILRSAWTWPRTAS